MRIVRNACFIVFCVVKHTFVSYGPQYTNLTFSSIISLQLNICVSSPANLNIHTDSSRSGSQKIQFMHFNYLDVFCYFCCDSRVSFQ